MEKIDKIKIIIVDDNHNFIEGLRLLISSLKNFEIIDTYYNGLEAVNSKKLGKANLILMDIQMPVMNGITAAKNINILHPNLSMIAITMDLEKAYLEEIILSGFSGFIHKPQVAKKLESVIDSVLNGEFVFPDTLGNDTIKK